MRCCIPSDEEPLLSMEEMIEHLDDIQQALDMRCKSTNYQCKESMERAKRFKVEHNRIECLSQMRTRHALLQKYEILVALRDKVRQTLDSIDQAQTVAGVALGMAAVKPVIDGILKTVNVDRIDTLMGDLDEQMVNVNEIAQVLGRPLPETVSVDDEALLEMLDRGEQLPSVPSVVPIVQKNNKVVYG